jgi:hypothetical protein
MHSAAPASITARAVLLFIERNHPSLRPCGQFHDQQDTTPGIVGSSPPMLRLLWLLWLG